MVFDVASLPREGEVLCEHCGYGLNGLASEGLCPECGRPVRDSTVSDGRDWTAWERTELPSWRRYVETTVGVITRPRGFFRGIRTRVDPGRSVVYGMVNVWLSAYFFALTAIAHGAYVFGGARDLATVAFVCLAGASLVTPLVAGLIVGVRWAATRLTTFEARFHGMRMPAVAVKRAMHYHTAALLPVSMGAAGLVVGFRVVEVVGVGRWPGLDTEYIYSLCGYVVVAAGYLFWTYWMAMKNVMWANR